MSMTYTAEQTTHRKQLLPLQDATCPIPASNIKVYDAETGKLKRIEDKNGNLIRRNKCQKQQS